MTITVATNNARIRYTATSGQTAFAIPFEFFENDEIYVYVAATTLVAADEKTQGTGSTHYAVSGGGGSTGTVTFVTGITQGYIVTIVRDIPIERITDFTAGSTINRAALNTQLDTLTAMVGDLKDKSDRAIRLQPYDSEISLFLPTIANRAGKIFGFDTNGNLTADTAANFDITLDDLVMNTITMSGNANSKVNLTAVLDSQIVTNGAVLNLKSTKSSNTADIKLDGSATYGIDLNAGNKAIRLQDATLFSSTAEVTGALTAPLIVSQTGGSITLQPTGNQVFIKGTNGESRITFHNPAAPSMEFTGDSSIIGSGTFLLDVAGDITLDAAGDQIFFKDNGDLRLTFNIGSAGTSIQSASALTIKATSSDISLQPEGGQVNIIGTSGQARFQFDNADSPTIKYYQNSNTTTLGVVDPTGTRTLLLPDESGTIHSSGGTTTHANITVSSDGKVQFRDAAIYIQSGADGHLDLVADTEIHIAATTVNVDGLMDISGNLSVGGNFDVTGTIDFSDANITNVGLISLDKITNDGSAGITLDSSVGIVLDASSGQIIFKDDNVTRLTVAVNSGSTQSITSAAGLKLNSGTDITLEADGGQVYITDPSGNDNFQFNGASSPTLGIHQNSNVTNLGLVDPTATRTILFPDASDTLVGKATTDTLTNKTLTAPTLTGTTVVASLDISGDIDVDGTTNLDAVDIDGAVDMASTLAVGTRVGIGVAAHSSAGLNITTTNQHIRLNNGSELGVISVLSGGELDIWGNGDGESINFRTGSGNGSVVMNVVGNKVGIGTSSIDGTLHVHTASAGTVTASSQADDLVVENNTEGGMTIITPDDQSARIRFTSPSTNTDVGGATIFYRQNINKMLVGTAVSGGVLSLASGAGNETMTLDASGNVGIGTSSPSAGLTIQAADGSTSGTIMLTATSVASAGMACDANGLNFGTDTGGFVFKSGASANDPTDTGTTRVTIEPTDSSIFTNAGNGVLRNFCTNGSYGSLGINSHVNRTSTGGNYFHFSAFDSAANAYRWQVHDDGDVVNVNNSYGAISDVKLKENIADATSQWDDVKALTVRKYSMKADNLDAPNRLGVISQELEAAGMGGLVTDISDRDAEGVVLSTSTKHVKYSILYMKAIKALQEAMTRIETLETKVAALEG